MKRCSLKTTRFGLIRSRQATNGAPHPIIRRTIARWNLSSGSVLVPRVTATKVASQVQPM